MNGFAIQIELMEWEKLDGHTEFKHKKSHYVGSFSRETSGRAYEKLDKLLDQFSLKRHPTKARRRKKG